MKTIIILIDFSDVTQHVITQGKILAQAFESTMYLIHVVAPDPEFIGYDVGPECVRDQKAGIFRKKHQQLHKFADELRHEGYEVTPLLVQGPTVDEIVKEIAKLHADLIITGTHKHGFWHKLFHGSLDEGLMIKTPCPMLIVPVEKHA